MQLERSISEVSNQLTQENNYSISKRKKKKFEKLLDSQIEMNPWAVLVKKERKKKIIIITHLKLLRTLRQRSFLYLYFIYRLHRDKKIIMDLVLPFLKIPVPTR